MKEKVLSQAKAVRVLILDLDEGQEIVPAALQRQKYFRLNEGLGQVYYLNAK